MNGAVISDCDSYRYRLWRHLKPCTETLDVMAESMDGGDRIVYIMLNPSTADASVDDPTIHKCAHFARELGATRFDVVNLFAYRATDPRHLKIPIDPVGPDNDRYIRETIKGANMIIAAWGASSKNVNKTRADEVVDMVTNLGHGLWALSITKHGHPGHPLYLPNDTHPIRWRASA